jgi:hypothetical protein
MYILCDAPFWTVLIITTRKHLIEDVLPYTCILEDCPCPMELYVNRQNWLDHMNKDHSGARHWICFACAEFERPTFNKEDEFFDHLGHKHQSGIKASQIPVLLSAWSRTTPTNIQDCPLCPFQDNNASVLLGHIAKEVHAFSLRSLPWGPQKNEEYPEDDGNYKNHFQDNQYFGDGSEHSSPQGIATASLQSLDLEELPVLDFGEEDRAQATDFVHSDLTEDAMKSIPRHLAEQTDFRDWALNILSSEEDVDEIADKLVISSKDLESDKEESLGTQLFDKDEEINTGAVRRTRNLLSNDPVSNAQNSRYGANDESDEVPESLQQSGSESDSIPSSGSDDSELDGDLQVGLVGQQFQDDVGPIPDFDEDSDLDVIVSRHTIILYYRQSI